MDYKSAIAAACNGKAILFVGAGFSTGAISLSGEVPSGRKLAEILCHEARIPVTDDLKHASSRYLKKCDKESLVEILRNAFTIKSITKSHETISSIPWKGIYTTNYDGIVERGAANSGKLLSPVSLNQEPRDFRKSPNVVLHINGYIDGLTSDSLNNSFKLTNTSYLTQQFRESIWSDIFIRHTQSAQAIFFVGYSLYDLEIQEILYADQRLRDKTFFIQGPTNDSNSSDYSELSDFGTVVPIGVDGFATDIEQVDPLSMSTDLSLLISSLDEVKYDAGEIEPIRDEDVFNLLLKGEINKKMVLDESLGKQNAAMPRYLIKRDAVEELTSNLKQNKNFVIHSDLGNGKTSVVHALTGKLISTGFRVFWLRDEAYECTDEIEQILNLPEPVALIFDNYTRKIDLVGHANIKRKDSSILILSARSYDHSAHEEELYFSKVRLDTNVTFEIDINKLSDNDCREVSKFLEQYGLWGGQSSDHPEKKIRHIKRNCGAEWHGVLLGILKSPQIQQRFSELFESIKSSKDYSRTVIAAFALNMLNVTEPTPHMIAALSGDNSIFSPHFKSNSAVKQLFNSSRGGITPKSAVLAEYALKNFPNTITLVESLIEICRSTRKKGTELQFYWDIYRDLASFTVIQRMLPESGKRESLIRFYEGLRTIEVERNNPLFWLQYAIARLSYPDAANLNQAKTYLDTALSIAKGRKNFTTHDIDTQIARYYLEHVIHMVSSVDTAFAEFKLAHASIVRITRIEKYKKEAFRPARLYESVFKKFESQLTNEQRLFVALSCKELLQIISTLPRTTAEDKTVTSAADGLTSIIRRIDFLRVKDME